MGQSLMGVWLAGSALGMASATAATAQTASTSGSFDIPAQKLSDAIAIFGQQSGMQITATAETLAKRTSTAVAGSMAAPEALCRLLAGTGLTFRFIGPRAVRIEVAPVATGNAIQLGAVQVDGAMTEGSPTYANGYDPKASDPYAKMPNPPTTVGSKTPLAQRDIAQTVTVITQEQIQQQAMLTLNDAMRWAPGVTIGNTDSERTDFFSRGFPITTWMLDGMPTTQNLASIAPNLAMFDRVEILQGPDGLMSGFSNEGGTLNMVRKRAPKTFQFSAQALAGTYNDFGGTLDVGSPLNASGSVRARVVGNIQSQNLMQDTSYRHDALIYGTVEADLSPTTQVRVGGSYTHVNERANWEGALAYDTPVNGQYILFGTRSTNTEAPWAHNTYAYQTGFAELDQKLGAGWSGKLAFNYLGSHSTVLQGFAGGFNIGSDLADYEAETWHQFDNQESIDAFVTGPLQLFGRAHALTFGATYQREDFRDTAYRCGPNDSAGGDIFCDAEEPLSWVQTAPRPAFDGPNTFHYTTAVNQYGLYGNARISLADPLTLVAGARAIWWDTTSLGSVVNASHVSGKVTPYAGLIYKIGKHYSAYFSYATIYNPQTSQTVAGTVLPPLEGVQYEAGVRGDYLDGRLNTAIALFQLTEENRAVSDPRYPNEGYYIATGRARSRGVEITANGYLTNSWKISGGYTYTDAKYLDSSQNANGVGFESIAPRHLFKLWTNYTLPGRLKRISLGAGAYVSSGTYATDGDGNYLRQGAYETFDLRAAYKVMDRLTLSVNVTNLTDRHYLLLESPYGGEYGNPRQVIFTLRYGL
ncbi:TonB-dependent siderophore receptor [Novosphingobium terrae]|uniref:TonB-dependent siderophore receptor n=1 Tax=Novosphingobium terrae TaxID=2726189 RepID=UPI0019804289|nr:TonB-dependent siderophore receptor [Novosphingobium terrae]